MAILLGCDALTLDFPTKQVFHDVTLGVDEGDRIGIVGKNGDGKSTLLALLAGALEPDEGRVTHRRDLAVGLLGQRDALDDAQTVHTAVVGDMPAYEWAASPRIRSILDGLISDVPWEATVGSLSGGQRRRVDLARLLIGDWDVLMLDEPTNHLDMEAITALNTGLVKFKGVLLFTSRDHQIVQTTANRIMEIVPGGHLIDKITTYDEYLESDEMARKRQTYSVQTEDED